MWNERYSENDYAYGRAPNAYFKTEIEKLPPGKLLLPAEGEGRNAIYAATLGWEVYAFDQSIEGQKKALKLAQESNVSIHYEVCSFENYKGKEAGFDLIALCYAHLPNSAREQMHAQLIPYLKPKGKLLLEGFSLKNLNYKRSGEATNGPRDPDFLFTKARITKDFGALTTRQLQEVEIISNEGKYHQGPAKVIRYLGEKV